MAISSNHPFSGTLLLERKDKQSAAAGAAIKFWCKSFHPTSPTGWYGNILLAADAVGHGIAVYPDAGLELP